ncbi:MAG: hypothetical protein AB7P76_07615 [Candidatus Melainabacteria bacterium]
MKKKIAMMMALAAVGAQVGIAAFAENTADILLTPVKMTTSAIGGGVGAVYGGFRGIGEMEQTAFKNREGLHPNLLMWPVDAATAVIVAPVGFIKGVPFGVKDGMTAGWNMWDGGSSSSETAD